MFLEGVAPYKLPPEEKLSFLQGRLDELAQLHRDRCEPYARVANSFNSRRKEDNQLLENYPFLPVTVFKEYDLKSTQTEVMSIQSSATTSGTSSKIFVDKTTKKRQTISAYKIWSDFIGSSKRPYLVFDLESTVRGTSSMSARGAAILSLAHIASDFYFVMREKPNGQMQVDIDALEEALNQIGNEPLVAYGFTYLLFQAHQELAKKKLKLRRKIHPNSVFLHSGGWKRLIDIAVDKPTFNKNISDVWMLSPRQVIDFYGAVEQVGIPYPDCSEGLKHVPYWAEVIIRENDSFKSMDIGRTGLIQLLNSLPMSAPNHSVLTEDLGEIAVTDGCSCGRRGTGFVFKGRAQRSEIRGCSDVGQS